MWGENMGFIYKITNNVNGKVYIGKTLNTVESRWKEHCHDKDRRNMENRPLYRAMNKYGLEHFSVETVEECSENLEEREIYWIKYYNSYVGWADSNGYNATTGGDGAPYVDEKAIIALAKEGKVNAEIAAIIDCCVDTVAKILTNNSITTNGQSYNRIHTGVAVYQKDKDGNIIAEYPTMTAAAKAIDGNQTCISRCCANKRKTYRGYQWAYVDPESAHQRIFQSQVSKIDIPREELKNLIRFHSFSAIGREYNCSGTTIQNACKHYNLPSTKTEINSYSDSDWAAL